MHFAVPYWFTLYFKIKTAGSNIIRVLQLQQDVALSCIYGPDVLIGRVK